MKKTVILILALLPIVLVITIAFAGKILSIYHHISVEKVMFVDEVSDALPDEHVLILNVGEVKKAAVRVLPERASNPKVSFTAENEEICTVDSEGNITGVAIGGTTVMVKTLEGSKTDLLNVLVVAERVTGVTLPEATLTLTVGENHLLIPTVEPYTAINKNVTYKSDNESVLTVGPSGRLMTHTAGTATVTVTTEDGGFTATCTVTVEDGTPPMQFDPTGAPDIAPMGAGYLVGTDTVDLAPYLLLDTEKIDPSTVRWRIASGNDAATLNGSTVTFTGNGLVTVVAYVGEAATPTYYVQIKLLHQ